MARSLALTIAPVGHSLGWRESVGRDGGADEAGGGAEKQLEAGAGPGQRARRLVDGALRGGR